MPIPELRALLDELGMRVAGSHVPLTAWEGQPEATLADVVALGGGVRRRALCAGGGDAAA